MGNGFVEKINFCNEGPGTKILENPKRELSSENSFALGYGILN